MVYTDSQIEPAPQEINGEVLTPGTNTAADAPPRLNIHARGFWQLQGQGGTQRGGPPPPPPTYFSTKMRPKGPKKNSGSATEGSAFFDVRVCYPNAESYKGLTTKQIYRQHESEKKRMYARGVIEVEQGSFTPMERIIVLQFHGFASVSFALLRSALFLTCAREAHIVRQELRWTLQITTLKSIRNQRDFRIRTFNIFHI